MDIDKSTVFVFDLDNVLLDFVGIWPEWIKEKTGREIKRSDIVHWSPAESLGNINEDELIDWSWRQRLQPMPGARNIVEILKFLVGAKLYVLTARTEKVAVDSALHDIDTHFPGMFDDVIFSDDKIPDLEALGADFFVDDKWRTVMRAGIARPFMNNFLLDQPWNRCLDVDVPYRRIGFLPEMLHNIQAETIHELVVGMNG